MKTALSTFIMLLCSFLCYAQENYSTDFGRITPYEINMKEYPQDKDAEAVVLYDLGDYYFQGDENNGFLINMDRKIKIKILKEAGISYANFKIPYYNDKDVWETITDIEAITYNMEGAVLTKTALDPGKIFDEKVSERTRVKKIALSNVRVGSIVEISYKIITPYIFNIREWTFQGKIPVVLSKLRYKAIPYYSYTYILKGTNKFDIFSSNNLNQDIRFGRLLYKEREYYFGMENLPAFKDVEFITSSDDYMASMNFQLSKIFYPTGGTKDIMTTWPAMCDDFLREDDFGKYIKSSEKEGKKIIPALNLTGKSPQEQIESISGYVKSKYTWNGNYDKFANLDLSAFLKQQKGNVGNINLFLVGLLKASGLDAYAVILSTRGNGTISYNHPFQQFFNYVIAMVKIGDKALFVDATEPLLYYSELPQRCINIEGLVIKPKTEEWVTTKQMVRSIEQKNFVITIDPETPKMMAKITFGGVGYESYLLKNAYQGKPENLVKYLKNNHKIDVPEVKDIKDKGLNKAFTFAFDYNTNIETNAKKLFIEPFCNFNLHQNPFKQTKRSLPVDLVFLRGETYISTITIPKGYKVEYLPENMNDDNAIMSVAYSAFQQENKINISASYLLKKNIYQPEDYIALKTSFNQIIQKLSSMIVFVKE